MVRSSTRNRFLRPVNDTSKVKGKRLGRSPKTIQVIIGQVRPRVGLVKRPYLWFTPVGVAVVIHVQEGEEVSSRLPSVFLSWCLVWVWYVIESIFFNALYWGLIKRKVNWGIRGMLVIESVFLFYVTDDSNWVKGNLKRAWGKCSLFTLTISFIFTFVISAISEKGIMMAL